MASKLGTLAFDNVKYEQVRYWISHKYEYAD
jgi:hypothetical protein